MDFTAVEKALREGNNEEACRLVRAMAGDPFERGPEEFPVPKFSNVASYKMKSLQEQGWQINGYAIYKDGRRGLVDSHGFVGWWFADNS